MKECAAYGGVTEHSRMEDVYENPQWTDILIFTFAIHSTVYIVSYTLFASTSCESVLVYTNPNLHIDSSTKFSIVYSKWKQRCIYYSSLYILFYTGGTGYVPVTHQAATSYRIIFKTKNNNSALTQGLVSYLLGVAHARRAHMHTPSIWM